MGGARKLPQQQCASFGSSTTVSTTAEKKIEEHSFVSVSEDESSKIAVLAMNRLPVNSLSLEM